MSSSRSSKQNNQKILFNRRDNVQSNSANTSRTGDSSTNSDSYSKLRNILEIDKASLPKETFIFELSQLFDQNVINFPSNNQEKDSKRRFVSISFLYIFSYFLIIFIFL